MTKTEAVGVETREGHRCSYQVPLIGFVDWLEGVRREESVELKGLTHFMVVPIIQILNTGKEANAGDEKRRESDCNINVSFSCVSHSHLQRTGC